MMKHKNDFLPLTEFKKREYRYFPQILTSREVNAFGYAVFNSEIELILNWQIENALQQSKAIGALQINDSEIKHDLKQHVFTSKK